MIRLFKPTPLGGLSGLILLVVLAFAIGPGCVQLGLATASRVLPIEDDPALSVLGAKADQPAVTSVSQWTQERAPVIKAALSEHIYGPFPAGLHGVLVDQKVLDPNYLEGRAILEEWIVAVSDKVGAPQFHVVLALPQNTSKTSSTPLILMENFCGNRAMVGKLASEPFPPASGCPDNFLVQTVVEAIFGAHIVHPPLDDIIAQGFGLAGIFPSEIAPDNKQLAGQSLDVLADFTSPETAPEGVLAVWAATFGWALDVLEQDPRIDANRTIAYGHSRHAKAALLAAAHEERIEGVIAHQSGTGGASLNQSLRGESIKAITSSYPHWFSPNYAQWAGREGEIPVEQHELLALIAPRPVLLGNGWKDVWSDPNGAFRAARAADAAWELFGKQGLTQTDLDDDDYLSGELAFQIRTGAHGVRRADWRAFLDWLRVWFSPEETGQKPPSLPG